MAKHAFPRYGGHAVCESCGNSTPDVYQRRDTMKVWTHSEDLEIGRRLAETAGQGLRYVSWPVCENPQHAPTKWMKAISSTKVVQRIVSEQPTRRAQLDSL